MVVEKPDMTPPPSPAGCTCSETGTVAGGSSNKHTPRSNEDKQGDEKELVLEDVKNVPVGRVNKVDGTYAALSFPGNKDYCGKEASSGNGDAASFLQDCLLLQKDKLQVL